MAGAALALAACTQQPAAPPATPTATSGEGSGASWRSLSPAGLERLEVAAAVVGGELYVAGGFGPGGQRVTPAVEIYDPASDSWRQGPDLPLAVHHAMGLAYRDAFVVLGGFAAPDFSQPSRRAFLLRDGRWDELPPMRRERAAAAAAAVGDELVVAAGQAHGTLVGPTEIFDGEGWRDGRTIPTLRDHVAGASDGEALYVAGGRTLSIAGVLGAFERYDPATDQWERLPGLPTPRGGIGAAVAAGMLVVLGGEGSQDDAGPDGVFPQAEAFALADRTWITLPPMPTPRHGIGVAALDRRVFVAAGGTQAGFSHTATLEALVLPEP